MANMRVLPLECNGANKCSELLKKLDSAKQNAKNNSQDFCIGKESCLHGHGLETTGGDGDIIFQELEFADFFMKLNYLPPFDG